VLTTRHTTPESERTLSRTLALALVRCRDQSHLIDNMSLKIVKILHHALVLVRSLLLICECCDRSRMLIDYFDRCEYLA
jgi:hypothetical protein